MIESLIALLATLNTLSPLAIIGLLGTIIFMMVKGKTATDEKVHTIASNHLHELPEMAETLRDMNRTLIALDAYLRARLNGGGR